MPDQFFYEELDNLLKSTESAKILVAKLQEALEQVQTYLASHASKILEIEELLKGRVSSNIDYDRAFDDALYRTSVRATDVLQSKIADAVREAPEYADPILLQPLMQAATYQNIFHFSENRSGKNSSISTSIDFEESAGRLQDWANAVDDVRNQLGSLQNSPARASNYWRFRVYHRSWPGGSYAETVQMRMQAAGQLAPYWELLDKGNVGAHMSSDWGGTPYPSNGPTNFIRAAEGAINELFFDMFMSSIKLFKGPTRESWEQTLRSLRANWQMLNTCRLFKIY